MPAVQGIATSIRNEIIRILQHDIVFQAQPNDVPVTIQPNAVVFSKTRAQFNRPGQEANQNLDLPGILVSRPLPTTINPNEWTYNRDLWRRSFVVQIVDKDEWNNPDREDSMDKWEEQVISAFMFSCLEKATFATDPFWVLTTASGSRDLDERRWVKDGLIITDIIVEVRASADRGIIA